MNCLGLGLLYGFLDVNNDLLLFLSTQSVSAKMIYVCA